MATAADSGPGAASAAGPEPASPPPSLAVAGDRVLADAAPGSDSGAEVTRPRREPRPAPAQVAPADGRESLAGGARRVVGQPDSTGTGGTESLDRAIAPAIASGGPDGQRGACTAPQLKRFIKSRVYVPMHELRRRFQINGGDDDVTAVQVGGERLYVGLPDREGRLLGELLRGGDVGYELSLDPPTPIVVGLYPMRPIPRS
jgi:hypothetical protein